MLSVERKQGVYTKYERARLIGARALQISQGAPLMKEFSTEELEQMKYNPVRIAKKEFEEGVLPIDIKRQPQPGE